MRQLETIKDILRRFVRDERGRSIPELSFITIFGFLFLLHGDIILRRVHDALTLALLGLGLTAMVAAELLLIGSGPRFLRGERGRVSACFRLGLGAAVVAAAAWPGLFWRMEAIGVNQLAWAAAGVEAMAATVMVFALAALFLD